MILFAITFTAVLLGAAWFSSLTWCRFFGVHHYLWILVPVLVSGSFIVSLFLRFFIRSGLLDALAIANSVALGFLNYAVFAAIACWIVLGASKLFGLAPDLRLTAVLFYCLALGVCIGGVINASYLRTVRVTVALPNLPPAWQDRDVALVSDIHVGDIRGEAFVARIVARLNELKPYAVFIPGDMFDGPEKNPDTAMQPWKDLKAPAGAWVVSGNHDEFFNRNAMLEAMERAGLRVLRDEKVCVAGMQILGVHDGETRNRQSYANILREMHLSPEMPGILLAHRPENLDIAEKAGVSLQLSGHTHGGQFWPWTMAVSRIYGRFAYGLSRSGSLQVFTSNGAGSWGPPLRVGTKSEIVILHLVAEKEDAPAQ